MVGDGLCIADHNEFDVRLLIGALGLGLNSARDSDNQCGSSIVALVLGRHVRCVRAGLPKSNHRQLTWLHAGMNKML